MPAVGTVDKPEGRPHHRSMVKALVMVALGGAVGSVARYLVGLAAGFPFGTLAVNVLGSFAIGILWAAQIDKTSAAPLIMVGILGGFTTFSTFSLDVVRLAFEGRAMAAGGYALVSIVLSLAACLAGVAGMAAARGA